MNKSLHVLIVEDSKFDARVLIGELENGGYRPDHELVDNPEDMRMALAKKAHGISLSPIMSCRIFQDLML